MTSQALGYTHTLFSGGSNLRSYALEVDKKENGGNNNGLIDGNEIAKFKELVKKETNIDFDFSNIKQATKKSVNVQKSNGEWIYQNGSELSKAYKSTSSKTIDWLNNKQEGKDIFIPRNKSLYISFMTEQNYMSSKSEVDRQEELVRNALKTRKQIEIKTNNEIKKSFIEKAMDNAQKFVSELFNL